jgi:putative membrane protein
MDWDLVLAGGHHLAVFTLVAIFAAEFALVRPGLSGQRVAQLARIDGAYGAIAMLVIAIGLLRIFFGAVDPSYYWGNHAFWGKMGAFIIVGLLSVPPTLAYRRWAKAGQGEAGYAPAAADIARSRRFIHLQALFLALIPLFAAAMARGYGN